MESRLDIIRLISNLIFIEDEVAGADLMIVPGSSQLSVVKKAVGIYKKGLCKKIIFTGSFNDKLLETESEWSRSYALKRGVCNGDIFCESKSTNTKENAVFARKLAKSHNLKLTTIIIPCKTYHAMRVKMTFRSEFPTSRLLIIPVVDQRQIIKSNWYRDVEKKQIVMKELEKIGCYFLKGDISL